MSKPSSGPVRVLDGLTHCAHSEPRVGFSWVAGLTHGILGFAVWDTMGQPIKIPTGARSGLPIQNPSITQNATFQEVPYPGCWVPAILHVYLKILKYCV